MCLLCRELQDVSQRYCSQNSNQEHLDRRAHCCDMANMRRQKRYHGKRNERLSPMRRDCKNNNSNDKHKNAADCHCLQCQILRERSAVRKDNEQDGSGRKRAQKGGEKERG